MGLEHIPIKLDQLRCVVAGRSARRAAKGDAVPSVERRNAADARHGATRRAGAFCGAGWSQGSPVGPATRFALLLPATQNASGAADATWSEHALAHALAIGAGRPKSLCDNSSWPRLARRSGRRRRFRREWQGPGLPAMPGTSSTLRRRRSRPSCTPNGLSAAGVIRRPGDEPDARNQRIPSGHGP
jgi:hypothetical protein